MWHGQVKLVAKAEGEEDAGEKQAPTCRYGNGHFRPPQPLTPAARTGGNNETPRWAFPALPPRTIVPMTTEVKVEVRSQWVVEIKVRACRRLSVCLHDNQLATKRDVLLCHERIGTLQYSKPTHNRLLLLLQARVVLHSNLFIAIIRCTCLFRIIG